MAAGVRSALVVALALALAPALGGCGKGGAVKAPKVFGGGSGLPSDALDAAIGRSIGDPTTCVLIANRADGKVLYQYGEGFNCERGLPACDRPGTLSARQALKLATSTSEGRMTSCNSDAAGDRSVGWAEGRITSSHNRDLVYSAVMEGERALPGREMAARLENEFQVVGL
ncbi:MAG TPA: hypothetical protein VG939_11405 [Caulobacteraceae bacterium]|nr:hypothetical protein [Caulobacteraceae bacterium]